MKLKLKTCYMLKSIKKVTLINVNLQKNIFYFRDKTNIKYRQ